MQIIRRSVCSGWHAYWVQRIILIFALIWGFTIADTTSGQNSAESIFITAPVDSSNFPDISLNIRAFDTSNILITSLSSGDITVFENGSAVDNITLTEGASIPNYVYFMVDRNQYNTFDQFPVDVLQDTMTALVDNGHLEDGVDSIGIVATDPESSSDVQVVVEPTNSAEAFRAAVAGLTYAKTNKANTLDGLSYALSEINSLVEIGQANVSVIYIGAAFDGDTQSALVTGASSLAEMFNASGATFHALHTSDILPEPIQALVNSTGGQYIPFAPSNDNRPAIQQLYEAITEQAATIQISYRSSLDDSGSRTVAVVPTGITETEAASEARSSYTVNLQQPLITIIEPTAEKIFTRDGIPNSSGGYDYELQSINIKALLEWQDGVPRNIVSAQLLQTGVPVNSIQNPTSQEFNFTLDINDLEESTLLPIAIAVQDELGIIATSEERQLRVEVNLVSETILTPQVTEVVIEREVEVPVEVPVVLTPCEENPTGMECIRTAYLPWLIGLGSLIVLVVVAVSIRRQLSSAASGTTAAQGRPAAKGDARKTMLSGNMVNQKAIAKTMLGGSMINQKAIAKMKVLTARNDLIDQEIEIYANKTSFGRDPKQVEIQLYDENDRSTVSGLHCTLQYEPRKNVFYLTDDNSTAGTKVNGSRITPNDPTVLKHEDEIILGDLFRRGARLQFLMIAEQAKSEAVDDLPKKTQSITPTPSGDTTDDLANTFDDSTNDLADAFVDPYSNKGADDFFNNFDLADDGDLELDLTPQPPASSASPDAAFKKTIIDRAAMEEDVYEDDTFEPVDFEDSYQAAPDGEDDGLFDNLPTTGRPSQNLNIDSDKTVLDFDAMEEDDDYDVVDFDDSFQMGQEYEDDGLFDNLPQTGRPSQNLNIDSDKTVLDFDAMDEDEYDEDDLNDFFDFDNDQSAPSSSADQYDHTVLDDDLFSDATSNSASSPRGTMLDPGAGFGESSNEFDFDYSDDDDDDDWMNDL